MLDNTKAIIIATDEIVTVINTTKGWITVKSEDGTETKLRAKALRPLDEVSVQIETIKEMVVVVDVENPDKVAMIKVKCDECDHSWEIDPSKEKAVNIRCPLCKAWCRIHLNPNRDNYIRGLGQTASGNDTLDIGDDTAGQLRGLNLDDLYREAGLEIVMAGEKMLSKGMKKELKNTPWIAGEIAAYLRDKYGSRNAGMQRMNVGNILRGIARRQREEREGKE